jgi:phage pi2 protein 07
VQTQIKKFNTADKLNQITEILVSLDASLPLAALQQQFEVGFARLNQTEEEIAERLRQEALQSEESKKLDLTDSEWSKDDIALLTKGIVKFPPGTVNRWKMIAEFVNKPQKEAIKKAQELIDKRKNEVATKPPEKTVEVKTPEPKVKAQKTEKQQLREME